MDSQVKQTISSCYEHVKQAYDKLEELGAIMPENKNIANLVDTIYTLNLTSATGPLTASEYNSLKIGAKAYNSKNITAEEFNYNAKGMLK